MKKLVAIIVIMFSIAICTDYASAQPDTLLNYCSKFLPTAYISDGQQYKALLNKEETAEFHVTFYGGSTYRVIACCGLSDGNLIITLYDKDRHELFSNKDHQNAAYWDFKFKSTVNCIIEAQLDPQGPPSGFALLLIGFKAK